MADDPRIHHENTRGRPFEIGNAGKPKGARAKITVLAEKLLAEDAETIVRVVVDAARNGDLTAARLVLERIAPPRKDYPVNIDLPKVEGLQDAPRILGAILNAVAGGELTPSEGEGLTRLVEGFAKSIELVDLERRITELERRP